MLRQPTRNNFWSKNLLLSVYPDDLGSIHRVHFYLGNLINIQIRFTHAPFLLYDIISSTVHISYSSTLNTINFSFVVLAQIFKVCTQSRSLAKLNCVLNVKTTVKFYILKLFQHFMLLFFHCRERMDSIVTFSMQKKKRLCFRPRTFGFQFVVRGRSNTLSSSLKAYKSGCRLIRPYTCQASVNHVDTREW